MRSVMTWAVALGVVLATTELVSAQGRGMMGGPGLLLNPGVQEELKLTDEQKEKARTFAEKFGEKVREAFQNAQGDFQKLQTEIQKLSTTGLKDAAEFLKPEQVARLKQISRQQAGLNALANDEELQKELKLNDEQKEKIKKLADEQREKVMELFQAGGGPETREKMQALRKEYNGKVQDVLTGEQTKAYKELLGKPYEVRFAPQGGV